jgi:hypothetical protein
MPVTTLLTYDAAIALLGNRPTKKVDNNTTIRKVGDSVAVRLHETDVVIIRSDGNYVLNSGGYRTATTKDRINNYSPASVHQAKRKWYLGKDTPFVDGMVVDANGSLVESERVPDINEILERLDVSSKYGAPMGRQNQVDGSPDNPLYIQKVEAVDGDYDRGGAYWGTPTDLWCAFTNPDTTTDEYPIMVFVRSASQENAKRRVLTMLPTGDWQFYGPN